MLRLYQTSTWMAPPGVFLDHVARIGRIDACRPLAARNPIEMSVCANCLGHIVERGFDDAEQGVGLVVRHDQRRTEGDRIAEIA